MKNPREEATRLYLKLVIVGLRARWMPDGKVETRVDIALKDIIS